MTNLLWANKTIICDLCKQGEVTKTIELTRGHWVGVCSNCEPKKEGKNDNDQKHKLKVHVSKNFTSMKLNSKNS